MATDRKTPTTVLNVVSNSFARFSGYCAILTGILSLLFSITFVTIARTNPSVGTPLSGAFLLIGGFLATPVLVTLYQRLAGNDPSFALWAVLLSIFGAFGYVLTGGYDLAVSRVAGASAINPSPGDPLSLLSFAISGAGIITFSWLILREGSFPRATAYLGYLLGVLLILFYFGRLVDDSLSNPLVLFPGVLSGVLANPAWYLWLGASILRARSTSEATKA